MADMRQFTDGAVAPVDDEQAGKNELRNAIAFGMDMENFMRSDVGRYLSARAAAEIAEFRQQMDSIDATDAKAIRDLQQEIAVRKVWKDWIATAIQEGISAQEIAMERGSI